LPSASTLQMLGVVGVLSYGVARLVANAGMLGYNRYMLVAVPVERMPAMPRGFQIRILSAESLAQYEIDVSAEIQAARFAQGVTCLGAFNAKDELVGVNWVSTQAFVEDEVHVRFSVPVGAGWDTGLWVRPEYRLGRGFAALWAGTAEWLRDRGCHWSMSRIADYNLASILSHKRMGAVTVGHITAFRFFRWQYIATGRPRLVRLPEGDPAEMTLPLPQS
jgi:hypothetical protein